MAFDPDTWRLAEDVGTRRRRAPAHERHAWSLVFGVGLALLAASAWELLAGPLDPTPAYAAEPAFLRGHLLLVAALGVLVMGLAAGPLRRQRRWAWTLLLVVPLALLGVALTNWSVDGTLWPTQLALAALAALGVLLPARRVWSNEPGW